MNITVQHDTQGLPPLRPAAADIPAVRRLPVPAGASSAAQTVLAQAGTGPLAGLLAFGPAEVSLGPGSNFVLTVTVRARTGSLQGVGDWLATTRDHAAVLGDEQAVKITRSSHGRQISLVLGRLHVERRLERLLGYRPVEPVRLEGRLTDQALRLIGPPLQMVLEELRTPPTESSGPAIGRHLYGLVIDGLLLSHPHNYTLPLGSDAPAAPPTVISRAAGLVEECPTAPWTVERLAQSVHLSVRALQYGFKRDYNTTPRAYVRSVRLRRARATLVAASPHATTVRDVALSCGFTHMSRFARVYRDAYGETPSATLARPATTGRPS